MSTEGHAGGVFICYRREDTKSQAGRLYDRLADRFGEGHVFMDVDSIDLGVDFHRALEEAVSSCDYLLVLIGPRWLELSRHHSADPQDYVHLEVQVGLERDVRVVPVLVNGAPLPAAKQLPAGLKALARRQVLKLTDETFRQDVPRLIRQIEKVVATSIASDTGAAHSSSQEATSAGETWTAELVESTITKTGLRRA